MMKRLIIFILFCLAVTASLFIFKSKIFSNERLENGIVEDTLKNNSLVIGKRMFILKVNNKKNEFSDTKALFDVIRSKKKQILKSQFDIILTERKIDRAFIYDFIDLLNSEKIINYKVSSPNRLKDTIKNISAYDNNSGSVSAQININENNYEISVGNQKLISSDIIKIDDFIKNNLEKMKKDHIYITSKPETSFQETQPIFELLKKYNLYNFKLIK